MSCNEQVGTLPALGAFTPDQSSLVQNEIKLCYCWDRMGSCCDEPKIVVTYRL